MFDTRAAIRELRSLSEKRSLSALTEAEEGRWVALRQKLGLPLEVAVETASLTPGAPSPAPPLQAEPPLSAEPAAPPPVAEQPAPEPSATQAAPVEPEARWSGPSLDTAASHPADAGWKGPALEVPAWVDRLSERTTDPGPEEPPPIPFDDAPAARPPHAAEASDLGGRADEPVPLAPAVEFVSYSRQGEALDLPPESEPPEVVTERGLAELAQAASDDVLPAPPVPELPPETEAVLPLSAALPGSEEWTTESFPAEATGAPPPAGPLGLSEVPLDEGAPLEPPVPPLPPEPLPVEPTLAEAVDVVPAPEPVPAQAASLQEGAIAITPAPIPGEALLPLVPPAGAAYAPRPLTAAGDSSEPPLTAAADSSEPPLPTAPPATSTWAPGAVAPPVLAAREFGSSGEGLATDGLDPWPEPPPPEVPVPESPLAASLPEAPAAAEALAEDAGVETVGDEDLVHEAVTPTPLPILPPPPPSGSGGIRGFQFPRPPGPMVVPVPPTSQSVPRTRTAPSMPAPSVSLTSTPRAPAPLRLETPAPPAPRTAPAAAASSAPRAAPPGVLLRTPVPATAAAPVTPRPSVPLRIATPPSPAVPDVPAQTPVPPAAVAPATPRPAAPPRLATPLPPAPVAPPAAPPGVLPRTPVPPSAAAPVTPAPPAPLRMATPAPAPRKPAPPVLAPAPPLEDEGALPLLELVDEVEPPPPPKVETRAARPVATPTPAAGTGVFGPPMILNPGFVEGVHRVVIHTLEGQVHRGTVHDIDLQDEALLVAQNDGREIRIPARRVKAVFFVLAPGESPPRPRGERVQVTFRDGRQVVGHSEDHASGEPGFFVVPSDTRTNTSRVYVYRGGIQSITAG
jgi:hypothetical protein